MTCFLQDAIITDKKVLLPPAFNRYYQALVRDIGGEVFRETVTSSQKLEIKLNKKYEKQIKIDKSKTFDTRFSVEQFYRQLKSG